MHAISVLGTIYIRNYHISTSKQRKHRQDLWRLVTRAWFSDSTFEPMLQQRGTTHAGGEITKRTGRRLMFSMTLHARCTSYYTAPISLIAVSGHSISTRFTRTWPIDHLAVAGTVTLAQFEAQRSKLACRRSGFCCF